MSEVDSEVVEQAQKQEIDSSYLSCLAKEMQ